MDLWVRSQDKEVLQKITSLFVNDDGYIFSYDYINSNEVFLGKYKSKERALGVLDEIQKYINNGCKRFIDTGVYHTSKYEYRVYQMPKE